MNLFFPQYPPFSSVLRWSSSSDFTFITLSFISCCFFSFCVFTALVILSLIHTLLAYSLSLFCWCSVNYKLVSVRITIENGAIKFIKRARMRDALALTHPIHGKRCEPNAKRNKREREQERETNNKNIIKVKHRLYYSVWWNCFVLYRAVDRMSNVLNAFYAGIAGIHRRMSYNNVDGRYVPMFHVLTLNFMVFFFINLILLLLHGFSLVAFVFVVFVVRVQLFVCSFHVCLIRFRLREENRFL